MGPPAVMMSVPASTLVVMLSVSETPAKVVTVTGTAVADEARKSAALVGVKSAV